MNVMDLVFVLPWIRFWSLCCCCRGWWCVFCLFVPWIVKCSRVCSQVHGCLLWMLWWMLYLLHRLCLWLARVIMIGVLLLEQYISRGGLSDRKTQVLHLIGLQDEINTSQTRVAIIIYILGIQYTYYFNLFLAVYLHLAGSSLFLLRRRNCASSSLNSSTSACTNCCSRRTKPFPSRLSDQKIHLASTRCVSWGIHLDQSRAGGLQCQCPPSFRVWSSGIPRQHRWGFLCTVDPGQQMLHQMFVSVVSRT